MKRHGKKRGGGQANELPYFNFYPGDWLGSATRAVLSVEQQGAFMNLLSHSWMQPDGMLPSDERQLAAFSGLGDRFAEVGRTVVERTFAKKGDRLFNRRLMKVRKEVLRRVRAAIKAGKLSGEARAKAKKKR